MVVAKVDFTEHEYDDTDIRALSYLISFQTQDAQAAIPYILDRTRLTCQREYPDALVMEITIIAIYAGHHVNLVDKMHCPVGIVFDD